LQSVRGLTSGVAYAIGALLRNLIPARYTDAERKHHKGVEYLNLAMAQVTDNPAIADGSSIHQEAKQLLHSYLRNSIQPLMQTGKPLDLSDILHRVNIRKPKLVQQLGKQQVQRMAQLLLDQ